MDNLLYVSSRILKQINLLKTKKGRDNFNLFIAEGERLTKEIPKDIIEYIVVSENYDKTFYLKYNVKVYKASSSVFKKLSDTVNPQGILAVCKKNVYNINKVLNIHNPFFVLLENINDPGNLGTIIRTADAAYADAVFISKGSVDLFNGKTVRATMGSLFHLPIFTDIDLSYLINKLKEKKIKIYAAHLNGSKYIYDVNFKKSCSVLIGNEANGLSDFICDFTDELVKIPMPGKAESINASVAGGIFIYEVLRQRFLQEGYNWKG